MTPTDPLALGDYAIHTALVGSDNRRLKLRLERDLE